MPALGYLQAGSRKALYEPYDLALKFKGPTLEGTRKFCLRLGSQVETAAIVPNRA